MELTRFSIKLQDNYDVLNNWGREVFTPITGWGNLGTCNKYMVCDLNKNFCTTSRNKTDFKEITFEEFKKYILKEKTTDLIYEIL